MSNYPNTIDVYAESRTYWHVPGKIYFTFNDNDAMTSTTVILEGEVGFVKHIWNNLYDMFTFGKRQKLKEIQFILGIN